MKPDIAVIQECAKPPVETEQCRWFGDNPRQGILIQAFGEYSIRLLPQAPDVPNYVIPVQIIGPIEFLLFAVWSKANPQYRYIEAVVRAVEIYQSLVATSPTVLIGDLNSNTIWDATHPKNLNHSALVELLSKLGMVSSYHHFFQESHGKETRHTYYFQWKEQKPYHIDYCFVPKQWASNLRSVEIGTFEEWKEFSDHRPLLVEIGH